MSDQIEIGNSFINSLVGEGTVFRGDMELNGLLRIDGDFSGKISTPDKVLVGKNGRADCDIHAGTVVIGGLVKGNLYATQKVLILSTGLVLGNIHTPRLIVEEGVLLHGSCVVSKKKSFQKHHTTDEEHNSQNDYYLMGKEGKQQQAEAVGSNTSSRSYDIDSDEQQDEDNTRPFSIWKG
jgi:cytoskeletal protein CcmA (bactofilin family)